MRNGFTYIMVRTSYISMRWWCWWWILFCTRPTGDTLSWIFIVLAHWNNSLQTDMSLYSDTFSHDSKPTGLCSYSLMLPAKQRSNKYQFYKSLIWLEQGLNQWSTSTSGVQANHYTTDVAKKEQKCWLFTSMDIICVYLLVWWYLI
jgi:hypothetical protein